MKNELIMDPNGSVAVLPGHNIMVRFSDARSALVQPDKVVEPVIKETSSTGVANWGPDNLFPQNVAALVRKNPVLSQSINRAADLMLAEGLQYGIFDYDEKYQEVFIPLFDERIEQFLVRSDIDRTLVQSARNFMTFYNDFPAVHLAASRSEILAVTAYKAADCRWAMQEKTGKLAGQVARCFVSANWANGAKPTDPETLTMPVVPQAYDRITALKLAKGLDFIFPVSKPTELEHYYALADWNAIIDSGWLDVANNTPEFINAVLKNKTTINYVIKISDRYWPRKFPDWEYHSQKARNGDTTSMAELLNRRAKELKGFMELLSGNKKAGKSIMVEKLLIENKEYDMWTIETVPNGGIDFGNLETCREAHKLIQNAVGIDPNMMGSEPDSQANGASGSGKRVSFNMANLGSAVPSRLVLSPYNFAARFNNWTAKSPISGQARTIQFRFKRPVLQTLDAITPSKRDPQPQS